jgi:hypothetical protein
MTFFQMGLDHPDGDIGLFVDDKEYSRDEQIEIFKKILDIDQEFASELYDNGVFVKKYILELITTEYALKHGVFLDNNQNNPFLDSWYARGIRCQPVLNALSSPHIFSPPPGPPTIDRVDFKIMKIRRILIPTSNGNDLLLGDGIPVWNVKNSMELNNKLNEIKTKLHENDENSFNLWFRGQIQEYKVYRSNSVLSWLNYQIPTNGDISLFSSLARAVKNNPEMKTREWASGGSHIHWKKAFFIWVLLRNPSWFSQIPGYEKKIYAALIDEDPRLFFEIQNEIQFNPLIYTEADDFRQWFFVHYKYSALPLILQHYGMHTSTLDVTNNLQTALFFALHKFDQLKRRYLEKKDSKNSIIYLFININSEYLLTSSEITNLGPERLPIPERILRQNCGLLYGSGLYGWNLYANLIIGKFCLNDFDHDFDENFQEKLFPNDQEDDLYKILKDCRPSLPNLVIYDEIKSEKNRNPYDVSS